MSDDNRDFRFPPPDKAERAEPAADTPAGKPRDMDGNTVEVSEPTPAPAEAPEAAPALTEAPAPAFEPEPGHQFEPAKKAPAKKSDKK